MYFDHKVDPRGYVHALWWLGKAFRVIPVLAWCLEVTSSLLQSGMLWGSLGANFLWGRGLSPGGSHPLESTQGQVRQTPEDSTQGALKSRVWSYIWKMYTSAGRHPHRRLEAQKSIIDFVLSLFSLSLPSFLSPFSILCQQHKPWWANFICVQNMNMEYKVYIVYVHMCNIWLSHFMPGIHVQENH